MRIGDRLDVTFPRTRDAMSREFERLVSGLHAIELRLGSLELGRNWNELLADFSWVRGGDDVEHAGREPGLQIDFSQFHSGHGRELGRLENHGIASCKCGG